MTRLTGAALSFALLIALAASCSGPQAVTEEVAGPPVTEVAPTPDKVLAPTIWQTPEEVQTACAEHIGNAKKILDGIAAVEGEHTLDNTVKPLNVMLTEIDRVLPVSDLLTNVHPDEKVRAAAEKCTQDAAKFVSEFEVDRRGYDALVAVKTDGFDPEAKRFVDHLLRDYRRAGVDKDNATRAHLTELNEQMVKTGQAFSKAIRDGRLTVKFDPKDLDGLPKDYMEAHKPGDDGKIEISTDYPDFIPAASYAKSEKTRKALYFAYLNRAYPQNKDTFKKLLMLRYEYATTLGYEDWASYNAEDKMAKDKKTISNLIERVTTLARPRMEKDLAVLLARKKKDDKKATAIETWDRSYYVGKIKEEQYAVKSEEIRRYFDYNAVKKGVLEVNQEMYGLTFKQVKDAPVWSDKVEAYDVYEGDEGLVYDSNALIGRFYLDMHPRKGKYGHAAMFGMLTGVNGVQIPSASLVTNFPEPKDGKPALMEHSQVNTFFHEFGHLMHHILSGQHDWVTLSGINCEWDFVEAPSQMMEEWAWDHDVLSRFAKNVDTGEVIPAELVKKMREADNFGKGVQVMRQMFYAELALDYHSGNPKDMDLLGVLKAASTKYSPYGYNKGTYLYASFGHLEGYSSMYYTYMWSLVVAKDMFTRFEKEGLLNKKTAAEYRAAVLSRGGTVDAKDMVKAFLGRDYSFDAFKAWLEQ